ncbi:hypothetical protein [Agrococcus versicolor]|uniref:hypothetical protein n=1 Tax=Agrococcus versicolor TaxID=501482 RepID=UPI0031D23486
MVADPAWGGLVEHLLLAVVGAALGVVTVRLRPGWLPTAALLVLYAWMIVELARSYEPSVGIVVAGATVGVGTGLNLLDRRRARGVHLRAPESPGDA